MEDQKTQIETLIKKAAEANEAHQAMQYSQAAVNAANALCSLNHAMKGEGK